VLAGRVYSRQLVGGGSRRQLLTRWSRPQTARAARLSREPSARAAKVYLEPLGGSREACWPPFQRHKRVLMLSCQRLGIVNGTDRELEGSEKRVRGRPRCVLITSLVEFGVANRAFLSPCLGFSHRCEPPQGRLWCGLISLSVGPRNVVSSAENYCQWVGPVWRDLQILLPFRTPPDGVCSQPFLQVLRR